MSPTVLIVDDNDDVRYMLHSLLESAGFTVEEAPSGVEAVKLMETLTPSLLILDLMMPKLNGFAVLHMMNRNPRTHDIPVIVLSAINLDAHPSLAMPNIKRSFQKATHSILEIREAALAILAETTDLKLAT